MKKILAKIHSKNKTESININISQEELYDIFINNSRVVSIFLSPENLKEFVAGFVVSEGILNFREIKKIRTNGTEIKILTKNKNAELFSEFYTEIRSGGCSGILKELPEKLESKEAFDKNIILKSLEIMDRESKEYLKTGGAHTACLLTKQGKLLKSFSDIGRHNALDKVFGWALLNRFSLKDKYVLFTGRIASSIVVKAARMGMPLIVSNTAVFDRAVRLAEKLGICVCGFARNGKFEGYANLYRIK